MGLYQRRFGKQRGCPHLRRPFILSSPLPGQKLLNFHPVSPLSRVRSQSDAQPPQKVKFFHTIPNDMFEKNNHFFFIQAQTHFPQQTAASFTYRSCPSNDKNSINIFGSQTNRQINIGQGLRLMAAQGEVLQKCLPQTWKFYIKFLFSDGKKEYMQYKWVFQILLRNNINVMGLLSDLGPIQNFQETMKMQKILKVIGLRQFLYRLRTYGTWTKPKGIQHIKWGQEIEGHFLKVNEKGELDLCKEDISEEYKDLNFPLMFQYGSWMFEMIPSEPHNTGCNFYDIIASIRDKYEVLHNKSRLAMTIPIIPFMGVRNPSTETGFNNAITQSAYIDDNHIAHHPRFPNLTKNIRLRRGRTVEIYVPIFMDENTQLAEINKTEPKEGYIHMDAMAFGMGACCLQCTFSTKSYDHARYVYDQLNVISPIFLALTAGSPFFKGKVSDWDVRWNVIANCVDDRTENQRNPSHYDYIPTSRYNQANYYLWDNPANLPQYNDFYTGVKEEDLQFIRKIAEKEGIAVDEKMVFHLANIFKRDFLIVHRNFKEMTEHDFILFDMLNGTNWNSVRFKIPIDDHIGWRVEFRTMEVQLTADENSAYSLLIHLITRVLHENTDLNLYIPISKLRENFERAHKRDALRKEKFFFRTNIHDNGEPVIAELTVFEILFGKGNFRGLFYEIQRRIEGCVAVCEQVRELMGHVKRFLYNTASGERPTLAQWMRNYVDQHPAYTHNSILEKKVMDDLLLTLHKISTGEIYDKTFEKIFPDWQPCEIQPKLCSMKIPIEVHE